uniref:Synaptogyrin 1 n=1 Tax=Papio anubis TaxID=9555 RepID=A0A2I3LF98_PAPAN
MEGGAYGAGKAGGAFDPYTLVRQPHTILRVVSWLFSIVVFGSIVNEGYLNSASEGEEFCIYNRNPNACSYGVAVGVLAFLTCLLYLALDVYFPQISSVKDRKKAVLSDIGVSAFWAFLWFVGFCYLANQWQVSKPKDNPLNEGTDAARAAIAFSFFSIFTWAGQAMLAFQRYQIGADSALFSQDYMDPSQDSSMPYAPYVEPNTGPDPAGPACHPRRGKLSRLLPRMGVAESSHEESLTLPEFSPEALPGMIFPIRLDSGRDLPRMEMREGERRRVGSGWDPGLLTLPWKVHGEARSFCWQRTAPGGPQAQLCLVSLFFPAALPCFSLAPKAFLGEGPCCSWTLQGGSLLPIKHKRGPRKKRFRISVESQGCLELAESGIGRQRLVQGQAQRERFRSQVFWLILGRHRLSCLHDS